MASNEENWRDEVREKLTEIFQNKSEDLCRVLFFLDEEDKAYRDHLDRPYAPQWSSLKATMKIDKAFRILAERLAEETKKVEKDQEFRKRLNEVYEKMMGEWDDAANEKFMKIDGAVQPNINTAKTELTGLERMLSTLPSERKASFLISSTTSAASNEESIATVVHDIVGSGEKTTGDAIVMVALVAVQLTYKAYVSIKRWWKGEISGKRCAKNVLDATFSVAAGVGGGIAGAAIGSVLGPVGTLTAGLIGGYISAAAASSISDYLTLKLFGLPKEEALEQAYNYLGVKMTATNGEINTAFHKLCLKHHPDKGGNQEDFFILQCHMGTIKQARGDF